MSDIDLPSTDDVENSAPPVSIPDFDGWTVNNIVATADPSDPPSPNGLLTAEVDGPDNFFFTISSSLGMDDLLYQARAEIKKRLDIQSELLEGTVAGDEPQTQQLRNISRAT